MSNIANIVQNGIAPPVYLVDANGNPISIATPEIVESNIANAIRAGQGFTASTGLLNVNAGTYPLSIFNASSTKNVLLCSIVATTGTGSCVIYAQTTTSDPAYASSAGVFNRKASGAASKIAGGCTFTSSSQSAPGSNLLSVLASGNAVAPLDILYGQPYLLPANANNGLTVFVTTFSNGYSAIVASYIEY